MVSQPFTKSSESLTFFVRNGIQQYTQSPHILCLATIWFTLQNFRGSVICLGQ